MTTHTYPLIAVLGDYSRAAMGIAISIVPVVIIEGKPIVTFLFGVMIVVFVFFGLRTVRRHMTRIEVSDEGIAVHQPSRKGFAWDELDHLRVKFFSTHRKKKTGWFQVTLGGAGHRISIDSKITGFRDLVDRAARVAAANGVELDETSAANLEAMDHVPNPYAPS